MAFVGKVSQRQLKGRIMTPWHQVPAPVSKLHSTCWHPLARVALPAPAQPTALTGFPLSPWGSRMWQETTDFNTAPNSTVNRLCVLGNFSEPQRIPDYILVSQRSMLGPPVTEICVCMQVPGHLSVPLHQSLGLGHRLLWWSGGCHLTKESSSVLPTQFLLSAVTLCLDHGQAEVSVGRRWHLISWFNCRFKKLFQAKTCENLRV